MKLLLIAGILLATLTRPGVPFASNLVTHANTDSFPPLPPPPDLKNGWLGVYKYTVSMEGSGNKPKPYSFYKKEIRVHMGYVILERLYKGPIRVNQPDRNNQQRWESWIPIGTKKSWNYVYDSLHAVTVITSDPCCRTPHDHYTIIRSGTPDNWQEGVSSSTDLQIDYTTGSFIFTLPQVRTKSTVREIWKLAKDVKAKNNYIRNVDEESTGDFRFKHFFNPLDTLMGTFSRGQREIVFNRTTTFTFTDLLWEEMGGEKITIQPAARGTINFTLTLKRI